MTNEQSSLSLAKQFSYDFRVTRHSVESERKAETENGAHEEGAEDHFLLPVDLPWWSDEEVHGGTDEHDAAEQMRPEKVKVNFAS